MALFDARLHPGQHQYFDVDPDDDNPCTVDTCDPDTGVSNVPYSDNNICTRHLCVNGELIEEDIQPEDPCLEDIGCSLDAGITGTPKALGTACGAGRACDGAGTCVLLDGSGNLPAQPTGAQTPGEIVASIPRGSAGCPLETFEGQENRIAFVTGSVSIPAPYVDPFLNPEFERAEDAPVAGARVTVVGGCQYGEVTTDVDGKFSIPVIGGTEHVVRVQHAGYLTVDRPALPFWGETVATSPVYLIEEAAPIEIDPQQLMTSTVAVRAPTSAAGTLDARTPTLILQPGTTFSTPDEQGLLEEVDASTLTLTVTEYTTGPEGNFQMPAEMPPGTDYTYAMEINLVEANGAEVVLNKPLAYYLDNFWDDPLELSTCEQSAPEGMRIGDLMPHFRYDREIGEWIRVRDDDGEPVDGVFVAIVGMETLNGVDRVLLDATGDCIADTNLETTLGVEDDEREKLADEVLADPPLRSIGDVLLRLPIEHFSPHDPNNRVVLECSEDACPGGAVKNAALASAANGGPKGKEGPSNCRRGSEIRTESRVLKEAVPVAGTPFSLHYSSESVIGYAMHRSVAISTLPDRLDLPGFAGFHESLATAGNNFRISPWSLWDAVITSVGGQARRMGRDPQIQLWTPDGSPDLVAGVNLLEWSGAGLDGRMRYGAHLGRYDVQTLFVPTPGEGGGSSCSGQCIPVRSVSPRIVPFPQQFPVEFVVHDAKLAGLGGWTLTPHHYYYGRGPVFFGDGNVDAGGASAMQHVAKIPGDPQTTAIESDGNGGFYTLGERLRHIDADGNVYTFPKPIIWNEGSTQVELDFGCCSGGLAVDGDGNVFVSAGDEGGPNKILKLTPQGIPLAGISVAGDNNAIHIAEDGGIYVLTDLNTSSGESGFRLRHFDSELRNEQALLHQPFGDSGNGEKWSMDVGGRFVIGSAGGGIFEITTDASGTYRAESIVPPGFGLTDLHSLVSPPDGTILFSRIVENNYSQVFSVEPFGTPKWVAGATSGDRYSGLFSEADFGASAVVLGMNPTLALGAEGDLYFLERAYDGTAPTTFVRHLKYTPTVVSPDGSQLYDFDATGRIIRSLDALSEVVTTSYEYDQNGRISEIVAGNVDGPGSASLPRISISYSGSGDEAYIQAPDGQTTTITKDPITGYAESIVGPDGRLDVSLVHDSEGLLRRMVDSRGGIHEYEYDELGRLQLDKGPDGHSQYLSQVNFTEEECGTETTDPCPATSNVGEAGYEVTFTSGEGLESVYRVERDNEGTHRTTTQPNGATSSTSASDAGPRVRTLADGTVITEYFGESALHGPALPVIEKREVSYPAAAGNGALTLVSTATESLDPDNQTLMTVYRLGEANDVDAPETVVSEVAHSATGFKTVTATSPEGRQVVRQLDDRGRVTSVRLGDLEPTVFNYHPDTIDGGKLASVTIGDRTMSYEYFQSGLEKGHVERITTPAGIVDFDRDAFGRALGSQAGSEDTSFKFDESGNLTEVTPATSGTHTQTYNLRGLLTSYSTPQVPVDSQGALGVWQTTFDWDGERRLERMVIPGGNEVSRIYSSFEKTKGQLRRVVGEADEAGSESFALTYAYANEVDDQATPGQLAGVMRNSHTTSFEWFGGEITSTGSTDSLNPLGDTLFTRTLDDRMQTARARLDVGGDVQTASYSYDDDGLLACVAPTANASSCAEEAAAVTYVNDAVNPFVTRITAGPSDSSRVVDELDYNSYGELASRASYVGRTHDTQGGVINAGVPLITQTWDDSEVARDGAGRVVRSTVERQSSGTTITEYSYDDRGQLWKVDEDGASQVFVYDQRGNRLCTLEYADATTAPSSFANLTCSSGTAVYDNQDQLRMDEDGAEYRYTARGTLWQKIEGSNTTEFTYDLQGGLTSVDFPGTNSDIEYILDGLGRRVGKKVNGVLVQQYVWSSELRIEASVDANGDVTRYVYGNSVNTPELVVRPDGVYRVISDLRGSPVLVVDVEDGAVLMEAQYDAWGNVVSFVGPGGSTALADWPIAHGFAGGLFDSGTGLVRFGARDYDPRIGRWTSKDPILFAGGDTNLYVYVYNNPVNLVDPVGLWGITVSVGGGFASGFGSGLVPVGGGGGSVGFFIGTEGFGTVKSVHYTNGVGKYAGGGFSVGGYHSLERLEGYSVGGRANVGRGWMTGGSVDFTPGGEFAAFAWDLKAGLGGYAGGTVGATSVSNWYEEMRDFFLKEFREKYDYEEPCD